MKTYVRTTIVQAEPMSNAEFDRLKNRPFQVGYLNHDGYFVRYPDGYESWCPKDEFERVAREVSGQEFSLINDSFVGHDACEESKDAPSKR
jgi:hypothetical protein